MAAKPKADSHPVPPGTCDCGHPESHRSSKPPPEADFHLMSFTGEFAHADELRHDAERYWSRP